MPRPRRRRLADAARLAGGRHRLRPRPVEQELDATGTARLTLAATDQPGFADADGTPLTGWTYRVVVALDGHVPVTRDVELPAGTCDGRVVRLVVVPEPLPDAPVPGGPTRPGPDGPEGVPHDGAPGAHRPDGEPAARRGVGRRQLLGALALALPAAAAGTALAGPAAAQGPTPASRAGGRGALLPGLLPAATVLADDVVVGSEARPRSLTIKSSGAGGSQRGPGYRDTTGRLLLEAYQPHFNSYGETIRVHLKDPRAKGMITYVGDWPEPHYPPSDYTWLSTHPRSPVTLAWIGAHFLNNDDPDDDVANRWHGHINFETSDASGALRTRLEIKLIDPVTGRIGTDRSAIRTNLADFEVQVRGEEQLRVVGSARRDKDLHLGLEAGGSQPLWTLRAARGDGHLEVRRYLSGDRYQDSPLRVDRYTGEVAVGGERGTSAGLRVRQDGGVGITVQPLARGGQGILVAGAPGDPTARLVQGDVTGDRLRRFVVRVDGRMEWGDGATSRDTTLYRSRPNQLATGGSIHLANTATPPRPSTGGVLFVSGGALRYRGSSGTVTTLAPA